MEEDHEPEEYILGIGNPSFGIIFVRVPGT
jgi:hypothetical protein